jgi:hypothetical protein
MQTKIRHKQEPLTICPTGCEKHSKPAFSGHCFPTQINKKYTTKISFLTTHSTISNGANSKQT